jgi:glutathione S-transferase
MHQQSITGARSRGDLTLYHAPNSRATTTLTLLDELGASYQLRSLDLKTGEQREPAYLAINPMGKVPAVIHDGVLVTEQPAVFLYLADLFADAGLAPPVGDRQRGAYLRWLVFYGSCFEPAIVDVAQKREPATPMMSPYGDFTTMLDTISAPIERGPYLLGERFTAADVLWGAAFSMMIGWKLVPPRPALVDYAARVTARPAFARAAAIDADVLARFAEPKR